ncbi:hypothetical protein ACXX9E_29305 [Pseudomonas sp. GNP014]
MIVSKRYDALILDACAPSVLHLDGARRSVRQPQQPQILLARSHLQGHLINDYSRHWSIACNCDELDPTLAAEPEVPATASNSSHFVAWTRARTSTEPYIFSKTSRKSPAARPVELAQPLGRLTRGIFHESAIRSAPSVIPRRSRQFQSSMVQIAV